MIIFSRIKTDETTPMSIVDEFLDLMCLHNPFLVDWSVDKRNITLVIPDKERLIVVEELIKELFKGTILQMEVSADDDDPEVEQQFNYRLNILPSSESPIKQFLIKCFPAKNLIN